VALPLIMCLFKRCTSSTLIVEVRFSLRQSRDRLINAFDNSMRKSSKDGLKARRLFLSKIRLEIKRLVASAHLTSIMALFF